jgi:hypothetical protein
MLRAEGECRLVEWESRITANPAPPTERNFWVQRKEVEADVCVVGIAGLTTACELACEGRARIVGDNGPVAGGQTLRASAQLSKDLNLVNCLPGFEKMTAGFWASWKVAGRQAQKKASPGFPSEAAFEALAIVSSAQSSCASH